jgi:hypothetical protein
MQKEFICVEKKTKSKKPMIQRTKGKVAIVVTNAVAIAATPKKKKPLPNKKSK